MALVYLRILTIKFGKKIEINEVFRYNKKIFILFLWSMITMGSATAFIGLAILVFYFFKINTLLKFSLISTLIFITVVNINFTPFQRAIASLESVITFDNEAIVEADGSAALRIIPVFNTLKAIDINNSKIWLGNGIDSNISSEMLGETRTAGDFGDYGLISYILSFFLVFTLCIKKFFSLETVVFLSLCGAGIANIAYVWGILLLFTIMRYFQLIQKNK